MTLSDEDYGILYNAIEEGKMNFEAAHIIFTYKAKTDIGTGPYSGQHMRDIAAFIILSEGRELP